MLHFARRSLLIQLLSVYLLFVTIVLIGGLGVNTVVEQQLRYDAQASDQALAQEIALQTSLQVRGDENALTELANLALQARTPVAMTSTFQAFLAARSNANHHSDVDHV